MKKIILQLFTFILVAYLLEMRSQEIYNHMGLGIFLAFMVPIVLELNLLLLGFGIDIRKNNIWWVTAFKMIGICFLNIGSSGFVIANLLLLILRFNVMSVDLEFILSLSLLFGLIWHIITVQIVNSSNRKLIVKK
jgi:hypothetical protein